MRSPSLPFPIAARSLERLGVPRPASIAGQLVSSGAVQAPSIGTGRGLPVLTVDLDRQVSVRIFIASLLATAFIAVMLGLTLAAAARVTL